MPFKICMIGCGSLANRVHGYAYMKYRRQNKDTVLAACCDLDEKKAKAFKEKYGFENFYCNVEQMLSEEKPDAVCLITNEKYIANLSVQIIGMGYPVLLEKPPGINKEECLRIIDIATKTNVANQVAFNRRFIPLVRGFKKILYQNVRNNEIQNIRYDFHRVGRKDKDFAATAIHGIDIVKYIAQSDYKYISFIYQKLKEREGDVCNIYMNCVFESGATAQLNFCPQSGVIIERVTVNAYNNTFFLETPIWNQADEPGRILHYENKVIKRHVTGLEISDGTELFETNGFYEENRSFFDAIRHNTKPTEDVMTALQSVEIADCIRKRCSEYRK